MAWENTYLDIVKSGITPPHEANTSRYVHEVHCKCQNWKMEHITPQISRRGYIDYCLDFKTPPTRVVIEVKSFGSRLKDEHIRRYLIRPGPQSRDIVVGALTNLEQWHIYVAGKRVRQASGQRLLKLKTIEIRHQKDITHLSQLIGWRGNGFLKALRASLGESPAVLRHLISNDEKVLKAVRRKLTDLKTHHRIDARVPQNGSLRKWISGVLDGNSARFSNWSSAKLKQAVRSKPVVEVANKRLQEMFGSRSHHNKLRRTLNQIFK
jgi:hypothetical protein